MLDNCLLDLGNTRYKWMMQSELPDGKIHQAVYAKTDIADALLNDLLEQGRFRRLIVASVRCSTFDAAFYDICRKAKVAAPEFVRIGDNPLIPLAYQDISRFGVDRYLDLLGALRRYRPPFIVVDAGTGVTFDAVDKLGAHIGGCIYPGRKLLKSSLIEGADGVYVEQRKGLALLADSTEAGIDGGVQQGFIAAIDGILTAMQSTLGCQVKVILTGGDADWLLPRLDTPVKIDSSILFEGIRQAGNSSA